MKELEFKPVAAYRLDDDTPFSEYSGYARTGTRAGTEKKGIALTSVASYSQYFDVTNIGTFAVGTFTSQTYGNEGWSISFSAYYSPDSSNSTAQVKKADGGDVFTFSGTTLTYQLFYDVSDSLSVSYDYQKQQKLNVAVTYHNKTLHLFINGVLVDSETIDTQQPLDSTGNTYQALASGTSYLLLNNLAFYPVPLSNAQIKAIHDFNNTVSEDNQALIFGGTEIPLGRDTHKPLFTRTWNSDTDWDSGVHSFTKSDEDQLSAIKDENGTRNAEWKTAVTFSSPITYPNFQWADVWYEGKNVTSVQVSLDGTTWTTVNRYVPLTTLIPTNFNPANQTLHFKVNFTNGFDEAYLTSLRLDIFSSKTFQVNEGRTITYDPPLVVFEGRDPELLRSDWGIKLSGGTITFSTDPAQATINPQTIEIWMKLDSPQSYTRSASINSPTTTYVNGVAGASNLLGQWAIYHYTFSSAVTAAFTISGALTLGKVILYPTVLSATQIAQIVQGYTGIVTTSTPATITVAVSEHAGDPANYAYDWQISGVSR